jgi:hypothetical protein
MFAPRPRVAIEHLVARRGARPEKIIETFREMGKNGASYAGSYDPQMTAARETTCGNTENMYSILVLG